jgi:hypothetical protein
LAALLLGTVGIMLVLYDLLPLIRSRQRAQERITVLLKPGDRWPEAEDRLHAAGFVTFKSRVPKSSPGYVNSVIRIREPVLHGIYHDFIWLTKLTQYRSRWHNIMAAVNYDTSDVVTTVTYSVISP